MSSKERRPQTFKDAGAIFPRVEATWVELREKSVLGRAWSFRKPREVLNPQALNANVRL